MDALLAYIPEWNYWLLGFVVSLLLNVYQFMVAHKMGGLLDHFKTHGHAPDGKALVPADSVTIDEPHPQSTLPWERKS